MFLKKILSVIVFVLIMLLSACGNKDTHKSEQSIIIGAGATFPYPLYSKMFHEYNLLNNVKINYQSIGSGGGVRQLMKNTVLFGGTDAFITDKKMADFSKEILHIPTCLGSVALTFNLPELKNIDLLITPDVLADIFLGKIKNWKDARIKALNPNVFLPDIAITPVYRSDGSGTTAIFTDYLSKISPEWKSLVGFGKSVNWPFGVGSKGNSGVMGVVNQIPGSIAYVNLSYCLQNNMPVIALKNYSGEFIKPSIDSTSVAADTEIPDDTRVSLTNSNVKGAYPIVGFTWIIVYKDQLSNPLGSQLKDLLAWIVQDGQQYTAPLLYAPLPKSATIRSLKIIDSIEI